MIILFYLAGAVALISTVAVILQSNIVHALIYLILSLLAVAVVFYTLGAPFAAVLEAIVYAGAIMVLFLFVIMMLNLGKFSVDQEKSWTSGRVMLVPAIMSAILLAQLINVLRNYEHSIDVVEVGVLEVSALLFGPYVLAVELASILLLAGLVSAYHLAKK
ncbi:MAG: NADH-quinone oxidoreductase subunit J [Gammaproteobacteria bacterium]|jgi:NADH-quinone oxidoreductase subunit J|nr:NADH-quinone oxidoreductase subunit J [Gammaproteobacteria bacterium]MBT3858719.1 NADH-quinone oxidoreductase subunit J [Gammaproteobacteria bacterium]MBT3986071.1 NADH-quinone oxidoreductase subunit J [Gammaproteobacteria bacterium]MBT4257183.1 NADH-quinone oxidoreductase subunit J [Gammaproteobacteria bacterium]MBT4580782.1 NADH-quinone oxidoreductase subunit J [Gammaproteobacteria bacterium]